MGRKRNGNAGIQPDTPAKHYHDGFSDMAHPRQSKTGATLPEGDEMTEGFTEGFWRNVTKYGLGTVFAVALGYVMLTDVRADLRSNRKEHDDIKRSIDANANILAQSDMALQKVLLVLLASCVNEARTEEHRLRCVGTIDTRTR